ncbi:hypothetical protein ACQP1W_48855 [Spirillospora sp. CA-255316]
MDGIAGTIATAAGLLAGRRRARTARRGCVAVNLLYVAWAVAVAAS